MNQDKTKLVSFNRENSKRVSFNFLGFTFYWGKSRNGFRVPKVKTEGKRMRSKLKKVTQWIKEIRNRYKLKVIWQKFCIKLEGHVRYYGVSFNVYRVQAFIQHARRIVFKWLNRRSQKKSFSWEKFEKFVSANPLPKARICHEII